MVRCLEAWYRVTTTRSLGTRSMPTVAARIRRRHQAHGWEIIVAVLAVLVGVSFLIPGDGGLPSSINALSPLLADTWGVIWLAAGLLTIGGVLSGNGKLEVPGLILFLGCVMVHIIAVAWYTAFGQPFAILIDAYVCVVIYNRIKNAVLEGWRIAHGC